MTTYMEYLHAQQPIDGKYHNATATGVPVTLLAMDGNGSIIQIGATTSDMSGTFAYQWTPPAEGVYRITATFAGDDSYGSSWAETGLSIGPAPAEPTQQNPVQVQTDNNPMYFAISTVAIIIAIAVATLLLLRKK
jgi:hypothetical protein